MLKLAFKSKLNGRNKISAIYMWVISVFKFEAGILKWNMGELKMYDNAWYISP